MATVFVIQDIPGSKIGTPKINIIGATEFGDLAQNHIECGEAACSPIRMVVPGSFSSNNNPSDVIEYQQIMTGGDFIDFGNLTQSNNGTSGGSNGHGGL